MKYLECLCLFAFIREELAIKASQEQRVMITYAEASILLFFPFRWPTKARRKKCAFPRAYTWILVLKSKYVCRRLYCYSHKEDAHVMLIRRSKAVDMKTDGMWVCRLKILAATVIMGQMTYHGGKVFVWKESPDCTQIRYRVDMHMLVGLLLGRAWRFGENNELIQQIEMQTLAVAAFLSRVYHS